MSATSTPAEPGVEHGVAGESSRETALWSGLASARDTAEFCQRWLAVQCRMIAGVTGAVVLVRDDTDTHFGAAAVWPDVRRDMSYLGKTAQQAIVVRRAAIVVRRAAEVVSGVELAQPVECGGRLRGVVVLELTPRSESELQIALRLLHWGSAGLAAVFFRDDAAREQAGRRRLQGVLEVAAAAGAQGRFGAAATALVTELARRFDCERVSLGFTRRGRVHLEALSHSAQVKGETNLLRAISAAMEEAIDQNASVAEPAIAGLPPAASREHAALAACGEANVLTVPLIAAGKAVAALTLEGRRDRTFAAEAVDFCEALASLVAHPLDVQRQRDQWIGARALTALHDHAARMFGPRHPGYKLAALTLALLAAALVVARDDFRVSSPTTLEPLVQQAAVAPFDGYVREAPVRPGDIVRKGQPLARLDDRELKLERLKWLSQQEELAKQFRAAMAERNASQVQIVTAQLDQAKAQVARAEEQLARTALVAPFDGMVVSGDLTQQLGAPVERGKVLFELAPLATFRLVLKVDERDVGHVVPGQRGSLVLAAFPGETIGFEVTRVTPVSTPKEGRNYFRVEAQLDVNEARLRPGMEGVGKIEIGRASVAWIWTRQITEAARLAVWSWMP
jgi:RND family efflux transporter MFP subunit